MSTKGARIKVYELRESRKRAFMTLLVPYEHYQVEVTDPDGRTRVLRTPVTLIPGKMFHEPSREEEAKLDAMNEAAAIVCQRITQFGANSSEAEAAHDAWRKAWLAWMDSPESEDA